MAETLEQRIIRLRKELEGFKTALDRAEGSLETARKQLKEEFGHTSLKSADDDLTRMKSEIGLETSSLEEALVQLDNALQEMRGE